MVDGTVEGQEALRRAERANRHAREGGPAAAHRVGDVLLDPQAEVPHRAATRSRQVGGGHLLPDQHVEGVRRRVVGHGRARIAGPGARPRDHDDAGRHQPRDRRDRRVEVDAGRGAPPEHMAARPDRRGVDEDAEHPQVGTVGAEITGAAGDRLRPLDPQLTHRAPLPHVRRVPIGEHGRKRAGNLIGEEGRMATSNPPRRLGDASDSPPTVAHAIVRSSVLDRLEARWDRSVTTVVAGAGFGKSIAIGQAMRANRARPRGIEGWVSCRAGCESPERLAASVEAAFGAPDGGRRAPLSRLYAVFADQAPLHVSLVLDDVELLSDAGAALLDDLLRRAPSNLHLVLSGRRLPSLALARFRAADDVVEIDAEALRFDDAEVAALAASLHAAPLGRDLAGWPALVRLALVAPLRSVDEYVWEEVMRTLAPADREALLALCLLGASGVDEVEAVMGRPFDPDGFCARVPLVHRVGDRVVAHDLWSPYVDGLGSASEIAAASQRVLDTVAARGDPVATGSMAVRLDDGPALRRAAVDLVRTTLGSLPVDVAETWTTALRTAAGPDGPTEAELLDCALAHARSAAAPPAARLDELAARFHEDGDGHGEAVALALGTLAAEARNDVAHLATLAAAGPHAGRGRATSPASGCS